jgi:predicted aspartyl protease
MPPAWLAATTGVTVSRLNSIVHYAKVANFVATLALAACADPEAVPCQLQSIADLPMTARQDQIEVVSQIKGLGVPLIIDTGAANGLLSLETTVALHLRPELQNRTQLSGIGGTANGLNVDVALKLGQADFLSRMTVAELPGENGMIGGDMLHRYDLEIDMAKRRVRLWQAHGCRAQDLPWRGPRMTVPLNVGLGYKLSLPVSINGHKLDALLDSGAGRTTIRSSAAEDLGAATQPPGAHPTVRGVDGRQIEAKIYQFDRLDIGSAHTDHPALLVAPIQLPGGNAMVLGLDWLRGNRVWIAYRTGELFAQPVGP